MLLDTGLSGDLLFIAKGSQNQKFIPTLKRAVPPIENSTTGKVTAVVAILQVFGDTLNNSRNANPGKTLSKPNTRLNSKSKPCMISEEKTIAIDSILLPMRNIVYLQLKPSVTRALRHNTSQAQEPVSTRNATKRVI